MGKIISCCIWGLLSIILYLFIVVTFNQEYGCHTGIYVFVGCFNVCDMYTIASFLVMVLWKPCLRHGVACSYDKNMLI